MTEPRFTFDVARAANEGSYVKALALLREGAVRVLSRRSDGGVEASVKSERGSAEYSIRVNSDRRSATCSCFAFKTRGGLCKHGAAALLELQGEHGVSPTFAAHQRKLAGDALETSPPKSFAAHQQKLEQTAPDTSPKQATRQRAVASAARATPADAKRRRCTDATLTKLGFDDMWLQETSRAEQGLLGAPIAQPRFPTPAPSASSSSDLASKNKSRAGAMRSALSQRMLMNSANAGNDTDFCAELQRRGDKPLDDTSTLLHAAILGDEEVGAEKIVSAILASPQAGDVINSLDASGRSALHVAVGANRIGLCQLLLQRNADLHAKDASGRTALDIARKRKLDASNQKLEDPIVCLLRTAMH